MFAFFFQIFNVFCIDNMPNHITHLGDNVYVFPTLFNDQVFIHIRRFQLYGNKMYPTKDGINFLADVLVDCFTTPNESSTRTSLFISTMGDDGYNLSKGNQCFLLSTEQWHELQNKQRWIFQYHLSICIKTLYKPSRSSQMIH